MAVHVVYRSYGGENTKDRPEFYSKRVCLASCIRAAEAVGADFSFLNDGPVPEDRLEVMRTAGTIAGSAQSRGMRHSYRSALEYALAQPWADDDIVWFSEDDYLYTPQAFERLVEFAAARPDTTYFALFGFSGTPENVAAGIAEHDLVKGWDPVRVTEAGLDWQQIDSTASTFGVRMGALRRDFRIFTFCMVPHKHMLRDHDTMMVLQGYAPHPTGQLLKELVGLAPGDAKEKVRKAVLAPFLLATNVRAHRLPKNRRVLFAADPNLAAHLEVALLPPRHDWAAEAETTTRWLAARLGATPTPAPDAP